MRNNQSRLSTGSDLQSSSRLPCCCSKGLRAACIISWEPGCRNCCSDNFKIRIQITMIVLEDDVNDLESPLPFACDIIRMLSFGNWLLPVAEKLCSLRMQTYFQTSSWCLPSVESSISLELAEFKDFNIAQLLQRVFTTNLTYSLKFIWNFIQSFQSLHLNLWWKSLPSVTSIGLQTITAKIISELCCYNHRPLFLFMTS